MRRPTTCPLWSYFDTRLPPGIKAKGGTEEVLPWICLAGAVVSFLTGVAALALKPVEGTPIDACAAMARSRGTAYGL